MEYLLLIIVALILFGLHFSFKCPKGGYHDFGPEQEEEGQRFHVCRKCKEREDLPSVAEIKNQNISVIGTHDFTWP